MQFIIHRVEDVTEYVRKEVKIGEMEVEIYKWAQEIQENNKKVIELNKELEAFSYSVSHDLRAPLRIIDGYSKMLESDYGQVLDEEGKRLVDIVTGNVRRMGTLIDDLLDISRLGRTEMVIQQIDMSKLVKSVIKEQNLVPSKEGRIEVADLEPVTGDTSLIRQVWINLISNAIKYSGKNEIPEIQISSIAKNEEIVYSIKDNGVGFDMKYAHKLFRAFQRLHKITEFEGTGIGLALVNRILMRHNGKVWAESRKGRYFLFQSAATLLYQIEW